jgi:hypothetical protein
MSRKADCFDNAPMESEKWVSAEIAPAHHRLNRLTYRERSLRGA